MKNIHLMASFIAAIIGFTVIVLAILGLSYLMKCNYWVVSSCIFGGYLFDRLYQYIKNKK